MDISALADKYGPWFIVLLVLLYAFRDRILPAWLQERMAGKQHAWQVEKDERDKLEQVYEKMAQVYERFADQQSKMVQFLGQATASIQMFTHALDGNTQMLGQMRGELHAVGEAVARGPQCPLPGCPLWKGTKLGVSVPPALEDSASGGDTDNILKADD